MGLFNRKKKVEEESLDTRDVLASSLNTTPKAAPATNTVAEGSGLAAVIDLMRAKADGQVTLNLTQTGNDMSYKLYQRGSEIESGDIVPGGEWFKPVADLYVEEEKGPRGTWNRALIVVNPAIGGDDAVQVSFMNTETSSSHNLNYGLTGAAAVAGAATGFAAAPADGSSTAAEAHGVESNEADEAASAASAKHHLDSVSARFADDKKADQNPAEDTAVEASAVEETAMADASAAATASNGASGLFDRASDSETTETVEEGSEPTAEVEETVATPTPQIVGTAPAYTQRTSQNAAHVPAIGQEDAAAASESEEAAATETVDEVAEAPDGAPARSAYSTPRFAHRAESTPVDQTQTEETQADAEGATADETATAAEEAVEPAETAEYAEPAETVEAEDSATVVVGSDTETEDGAETGAQVEETTPDAETAETIDGENSADQDSADHQTAVAADAEPETGTETDAVSSEYATLTPAISHDGLSTSPAQLPDHLDDEEFLETDEAAPASTAYAAPAVVPGNMDAPMAGSGVDVAPSYSQQTLTKPSENRKAAGNLVLSEVEVVSRFAPAYDALFGANGTALDVSTVLIRVRTLGSYYDALTHVRRNGFWEQVRTFDLIPEDVLAILQLKADSYKEGYGSPLAMNIRFTPGIPVSVAFDYADEEAFVRYPEHLPAQQYVEELRMFPRTGANIPAHVNEALASWTF